MRAGPSWIVGLAVTIGLILLTTGCEFNTTDSRIYLHAAGWYRDQTIVVPFNIDHDARYAEYTYEYDDGNAWVIGETNTIRIPNGGGGLIEFEAADPARAHRLTASVLGRSAPSEPLVPVDTVVHRFGIDGTTPGVGLEELIVNLYQGGSDIPLPEPWPDFFDPALSLEMEVDHVEFDNPSGSRTWVNLTWDGSVPNERSEVVEFRQRFRIWDGGSGSYFRELKFIAIDGAGNRSGVRTVILESP